MTKKGEFEEKFTVTRNYKSVKVVTTNFKRVVEPKDVWEWIDKNFTPNEKLLDENMHERVVNATLAERIELAQKIKERVLQRWDAQDLNKDQRNMLNGIVGTIDTFINTVTLD